MAFNSNYVSTPNRSLEIQNLRWNHDEQRQEHRNPFAKDRDRILYSKSFMRLRGKTQIFMLHENDYIRTRLTHSLEVNQIAKSIACALGQNIDLVEAIALGHDAGHTPFGHVGERTLADIIDRDKLFTTDNKGFKHNLQALRLFCDLEKGADFPKYAGLNLTKYTLWGIAHHSSINYERDERGNILLPLKSNHPVYDAYLNVIKNYWSFEGFIVALADEIAQRHHDIEDGLRYDLITRAELIDQISNFRPLFSMSEKSCMKRLQEEMGSLEEPVFNALFSRLVVNMYITDVIKSTRDNLRQFELNFEINNQSNFQSIKNNITENDYNKCVSFSTQLKGVDDSFHQFLKSRILSSYQAQAMDGKAKYLVRKLYEAFVSTPEQLRDTSIFSYARQAGLTAKNRADILDDIKNVKLDEDQNREKAQILRRCIVDYIGGMTDQFAYNEFDRLYGTRI